ncbi:MAG TPA: hypothetical protein VM681_06080 [Candidatus Thermoplasmatota archaeon]|nr:hypothetical protein [Candidatus Thermoplasmatota archaeon]
MCGSRSHAEHHRALDELLAQSRAVARALARAVDARERERLLRLDAQIEARIDELAWERAGARPAAAGALHVERDGRGQPFRADDRPWDLRRTNLTTAAEVRHACDDVPP